MKVFILIFLISFSLFGRQEMVIAKEPKSLDWTKT